MAMRLAEVVKEGKGKVVEAEGRGGGRGMRMAEVMGEV